jgi:glycosyltransferase involved in cell wall biosynthesis
MGKKKSGNKKELPFVSICTPTFNRRPFWEYAIKCFNHQDYY